MMILMFMQAACLSAIIDTRGPINTPGIKGRITPNGVEAIGYRFLNNGKKQTPIESKWIWLNEESYIHQKPFVALFRKEVDLSSNPDTVTAWMSADVRYRLWINGKLASRGPADIGRDYSGTATGHWLHDFRVLTTLFHAGKNIIAAEVISEILTGNETSTGHRGFIFEADVQSDGVTQKIKSDNTWQAVQGDYLHNGNWIVESTGQHAGGIIYDAKKEPIGWQSQDFISDSWPACSIVNNHWPLFDASEIPPSMEVPYPAMGVTRVTGGVQCSEHPFKGGQKVIVTSNGSFTLRYDRVLSAFVGFKVKGSAGASISIMPNERNAPGYNRTVRMELRDGIQYFELPFFDSFSVINIDVSGITTPIEIQNISAVFTSQPLEYKGKFACSDPELNKIWESCRWATQICLQTHHLDSPHHQEPISDPGDYLIEDLASYYCFDNPRLARQDLRKFAHILQACNYRNFHTSYALLWLQTLLNYYDYTGDRELIKELSPTVKGLLSAWDTFKGRNGLISEAPNYMFMDWVTIAGFECHHPPAVIGQGYISAFYYRALMDASRVADLCGDRGLVRTYRQRREAIKTAFNKELWDEAKGLYRDGKPFQTSITPGEWLPADRDIETFSPHVNTLAVLYDLAPQNAQSEIIEKVVKQNPLNCQPYFMHFVLDAIRHAGLFEKYGLTQMRRWKIVEDTKTFREMWDTGDLSHGWIATPLIQMSSVILGVKPATPGFDNIVIAPQICDLDWAKGSVPTPHGNIDVAWSHSGQTTEIEVEIPRKSSADVELSFAKFIMPTVSLNQRIIWTEGKSIDLKSLRKSLNPTGEVMSIHLSSRKSHITIHEK